MKKLQLLIISIVLLAMGGCSALNPNVGTRTGDAAYKRGDCATAMKIYEAKAKEGQPWAETRLGIVNIDGVCKPRDYAAAIVWLKKAASYESKTRWEKGEDLSTGPAGFFNTTTSSAIAASVLAQMYEKGQGVEANNVTAWLWANFSVEMAAYKQDKPRFSIIRTQIEQKMTSDELLQARKLSQSWTAK
jgi:TPR repeat protein